MYKRKKTKLTCGQKMKLTPRQKKKIDKKRRKLTMTRFKLQMIEFEYLSRFLFHSQVYKLSLSRKNASGDVRDAIVAQISGKIEDASECY